MCGQTSSKPVDRITAARLLLEEGIYERRHGGTGGENDQATQQKQAYNNGEHPEFLSIFHKRPKLY